MKVSVKKLFASLLLSAVAIPLFGCNGTIHMKGHIDCKVKVNSNAQTFEVTTGPMKGYTGIVMPSSNNTYIATVTEYPTDAKVDRRFGQQYLAWQDAKGDWQMKYIGVIQII